MNIMLLAEGVPLGLSPKKSVSAPRFLLLQECGNYYSFAKPHNYKVV